MDIVIKTPLMADKIKELLDGNTHNGISYAFMGKNGMEMIFSVSGDDVETQDVAAITKNIIKATDYGKGIFFSVVQK